MSHDTEPIQTANKHLPDTMSTEELRAKTYMNPKHPMEHTFFDRYLDTRFKRVGAAAGLLAATTSLGLILEGVAQNHANTPTTQSQPNTSPAAVAPSLAPEAGPTNPANIPPSPEVAVSVDQLEIQAGLDNEKTAKLVIGRIFDWQNAGTDQPALANNEQAARHSGHSDAEFEQEEAQKNASIFAKALFIPGWESDSTLAENVQFLTTQNQQVIDSALITIAQGNTEFRLSATYESVTQTNTSADGTERSLAINFTSKDNTVNVTPKPYLMTVTLRTVNGTEKISAYSIVSR